MNEKIGIIKLIFFNLICLFSGILHGVHWGLGHGSGELIGGFLISNFGAPTTFAIFGAFSLVIMGIYILVNHLTNGSE